MHKHVNEISWASLWRIVAVVVLVTVLFYVRDVLLILIVALVLSAAIEGPVVFLERRKIPRVLSVLTIFILGIAVLGLLLYTLIPVALIQLKYLLDNINTLRVPLLDFLGTTDLVSQLNSYINVFLDSLFATGSSVAGVVSTFLGNVFSVFVTVVLSFYLAISKDGVQRFIRTIFPVSKEEAAITMYQKTQKKLARWLQGQLVLSFAVGALTFVGLIILGNEYALVLALLAAVLELVPYVGPIATGIVGFLITLPQSLTAAFLVVVLFFIIQQLENHVLSPVILSRAAGVDPVTVVLALLAGSQLAGIPGLILAVPVTIVIQELLDEWSTRRHRSVE